MPEIVPGPVDGVPDGTAARGELRCAQRRRRRAGAVGVDGVVAPADGPILTVFSRGAAVVGGDQPRAHRNRRRHRGVARRAWT